MVTNILAYYMCTGEMIQRRTENGMDIRTRSIARPFGLIKNASVRPPKKESLLSTRNGSMRETGRPPRPRGGPTKISKLRSPNHARRLQPPKRPRRSRLTTVLRDVGNGHSLDQARRPSGTTFQTCPDQPNQGRCGETHPKTQHGHLPKRLLPTFKSCCLVSRRS